MSSETSMVTTDFRLQKWAAQIRECQSRPAGMRVVDWCVVHGITKANYYYRLRRVWEACLETIQGGIICTAGDSCLARAFTAGAERQQAAVRIGNFH